MIAMMMDGSTGTGGARFKLSFAEKEHPALPPRIVRHHASHCGRHCYGISSARGRVLAGIHGLTSIDRLNEVSVNATSQPPGHRPAIPHSPTTSALQAPPYHCKLGPRLKPGMIPYACIDVSDTGFEVL